MLCADSGDSDQHVTLRFFHSLSGSLRTACRRSTAPRSLSDGEALPPLAWVRFGPDAEVARRFRPRLVILFAGSAKPRGPFHVTMDNNDALETAHAFPEARLVAVHNDGRGHFTESQADRARAFETLGLIARLQHLAPGQSRA